LLRIAGAHAVSGSGVRGAKTLDMATMGERLELSVRRIEGGFDPAHLADSMAQPMSERLERSLEGNRFAGRLTDVASSDDYEAEWPLE
jgi:hypothetical protein